MGRFFSGSPGEKPGGREILRNLLLISLGSVLFSLSYILFLQPNQIAPGGISGIAIVVNSLTGFSLGILIFVLNIPVLVLAFYKLGSRILASSLLTVALTSVMMDVGGAYLPAFTDDLMLAALYGGLLQGAGMGLIFLGSATVGGTTLMSRILRIYFPNIKLGKLMLIVDSCIIICSAVVFQNINLALYAAIALYITTTVGDLILYGMDFVVMVHIVSKKSREIAGEIQTRLMRSVTYLSGQGGYTGDSMQIIYCVIHRSQLADLHKIVSGTDPEAFVTVTQAKEVMGGGFKR